MREKRQLYNNDTFASSIDERKEKQKRDSVTLCNVVNYLQLPTYN